MRQLESEIALVDIEWKVAGVPYICLIKFDFHFIAKSDRVLEHVKLDSLLVPVVKLRVI